MDIINWVRILSSRAPDTRDKITEMEKDNIKHGMLMATKENR